MSTATVSKQEIQRFHKAWLAMRKNLAEKGIALVESPANAQLLGEYAKLHGLDLGNTSHQYEAISKLRDRLEFVKGKEPASIRKPKAAPLPNSFQAKAQADAALSDREAAARAQEAKDAEAKKEAQAEKDTNAVIDGFLLNAQGGRPLYGKTAEFQNLLRQNVAKFRKDGVTWQNILVQIKTWTIDEYKRHERELERL
jgi:hypothetical protein